MIGVAMGVSNLIEIFNEKYYENLEGGILESFGRLFRNSVKLYVYPMRQDAYAQLLATSPQPVVSSNSPAAASFASQVLINAKNVLVVDHLRNLYNHLLENHYIESLAGYDPSILHIFSRDVLNRLHANDASWETMVPASVAHAIKTHHLFGYKPAGASAPAEPVAQVTAAPAAASLAK